MKFLAFLTFALIGVSASAQHEFQVWTEAGVSGDVIKRMDWSVDLNSRFGSSGLETFFPQFGLKYKVKKWFKPSIEYRYILDKDKYGNFGGGHRINLNANFEKGLDRFKISSRLRYQYAFDRLGNSESFDPDFDQAIRLKAAGTYDINNSFLSPIASAEIFYNPQFGPKGPGFSKFRIALGTKFELDGPHKVSLKYQLDKSFDFSKDMRHVLSVSYGYKI